MSIEQTSPIVPITPQQTLQNSAFIKNSHNRSSFCGAVPSPTNGNAPLKTFAVNRKSWSGNGLSLQSFNECGSPSTPSLETFKGTGTFPRNRERNNNGNVLTPNGNSTQAFRGAEVRRSGSTASAAGRRYAEIGNWNKRSGTFLEPHLVAVRPRDSSGSDARSTEDEERELISRHTRPDARHRCASPEGRDSPDAPLRPREFFERLQTQAMLEQRGRGRAAPRHPPPPPAPPRAAPENLTHSRESTSTDGEGSKGDCSSVGSSSSRSDSQPPCDIGLLERLIRTHPVWFLPGIQRAGAFHLLQGKEEGSFLVRESSQAETMAISVRLPADKGPYIEHYLIQAAGGRIGLETSHNKFDNIPELIAHYCQCCDELPVQLALPRALREAKNRHQLNSLALLGQEFWGYPMASPKSQDQELANEVAPMAITPSDTGSSLNSLKNSEHTNSPIMDRAKSSPNEPHSKPNGLSTFKGRPAPTLPPNKNGSFVRAPRPTPPNTLSLMSTTAHLTHQSFPSPHSPTQPITKSTPPPPPPRWAKPPFGKVTSSEVTSPEMAKNATVTSPEVTKNVTVTTTVTFSVNNTQVHNHQINENVDSERLQLTLANSETNFNGAIEDGENQNAHPLSPEDDSISSIAATLHGSFKKQFTANDITSPQDSNADSAVANSISKSSNLNQVTSPNGSNSVTSGIFSPTSQINSPNETISSKSGLFSPKSELFSPISRSSPMSGKNVFSPISNFGSPLVGNDKDKLMSPNSNTASSTPSGRSRRSKHSMRKESRHYQESDILESPGVYYRSSLMDKVSDYEDIWGPEVNGSYTTFKPNNSEKENKGIMMSKRPDLLPDTLPKLNAAKSTQSILEKQNMLLMASDDSIEKKPIDEEENHNLNDSDELISKFNSNEIIATTNSAGEIVAKRPDKLNLLKNANKLMNEERENSEEREIERSKENVNESLIEEQEKGKAGSPFYADPIDAIREAAGLPMVQRRKVLRVAALVQRYSEPPSSHPYLPLRDMHSIEELSPSSPNTSSSVDNLISLRSRDKKSLKPVLPPRVNGRMPNQDATWAVDSSWEFINKNEDHSGSENGTFPSLAEQESRLSGVDENGCHLTVHTIVAQRLPDLRLSGAPACLPEEPRIPPRTSCYDNVLDHRPLSEQASDDGTVFSEPWDTAQWDGLIPPTSHLGSELDEDREWESPLSIRKPLAAITRAKSFRDRLDPLLAAGRVRALRGRGGRGAGAGAALRAYALHLAQDKSTTFAQNIDHFIACTLDSKEVCPQVVMRNMRQFMSGMKNYLVKHGEREFEKEVEKERMKLKSTEFLNLDAILETVMHRLVVRPLRARLYALLADWHADGVRALHAAIQSEAHATPLQMGIKSSTNVPSPAVLATISKHFLKMQEADSPLDKLENLLAAISAIFNSIRGERALGADDLLPVLAWSVARCRLVAAELEAEVMAGLLPPALLAGEGGYYLTALFSAVAVLKKRAPDCQDSAALWRRSSLESGCGSQACVVRVALPDESRGSIRRVALPCRAGARARDLCRALAHQAAITNPQDYALFALYNGQETMLNENDCPQEVMSEKNGKKCILAYKRIDAKIAWPQQALLSLP